MVSKTKPDELNTAGLKRVLKGSAVRVVADNRKAGVAITVLEDGQLVELLPDKTKRKLGRLVDKPTRITKTEFNFG